MGEHAGLHATFAGYQQLPPYIYLLAYPVNASMSPMRVTHRIVGMDLGVAASQMRVEAYDKEYRAIPASTEYPAVTIHTMVDMVGQQFIWLPMTTAIPDTFSTACRFRSLRLRFTTAWSKPTMKATSH